MKEYWRERMRQSLVKKGLEQKYGFPGIYSISINGQIVYIGKSKDMLGRIAEHMTGILNAHSSEHKYKILKEAKDKGYNIQFNVEYRSTRKTEKAIEKDIGYQEGVYIRKYMPILNYQIPKEDDWHNFTVNKKAKNITLEELLKELK